LRAVGIFGLQAGEEVNFLFPYAWRRPFGWDRFQREASWTFWQ
jgi:hypothetical protein